jgi:hypothetical protein
VRRSRTKSARRFGKPFVELCAAVLKVNLFRVIQFSRVRSKIVHAAKSRFPSVSLLFFSLFPSHSPTSTQRFPTTYSHLYPSLSLWLVHLFYSPPTFTTSRRVLLLFHRKVSNMLERPQLSLSIGRRPSQLQVPSASNAPSPITPQTNSFFPPGLDSYFSSFNSSNSGPSTPPISSSSNGLYPPPFPGRRGLLRRNSSLSSVSSSIGDDDEDLEREWTAQEEETVRTVRVFPPKTRRRTNS